MLFIITVFYYSDSGRGTTSRPSSMLNSEGEPAPLTPQSTRSQVTTITTDSDQSKSLGGGSEGPDQMIRRRPNDCQSILSDVSGLSGYSGTMPLHMRKRNRPQVRRNCPSLHLYLSLISFTRLAVYACISIFY